jgi:F-type H+-transporting ATPase subunit epsilon
VAEAFHLLVVAPGRTIYDGKAESAVIPAAEGMMGILPGHAPFFGLLTTGTISAHTFSSPPAPNPQALSVRVSGGTVQVLPDEVTILAETAEHSPLSPSPDP